MTGLSNDLDRASHPGETITINNTMWPFPAYPNLLSRRHDIEYIKWLEARVDQGLLLEFGSCFSLVLGSTTSKGMKDSPWC